MLLVSGGTGFIGSAIVRELLARGEVVGVLGRDSSKVRRLYGDSVEAREADVTRPGEALEEAMRGVAVAIDCVQFPNYPIEDKSRGWTFEAVDLKGAINQVDAAVRAGVRRYVYLSGVGAAPDAKEHWFRFKWQAEQHLRESGLEWVVVRPTWVYGPNDDSLNRIIGFADYLPFVPTFGGGKQPMQPVFIDDVARVVSDAALRPEAANRLFELGGPEVMTMDDVYRTALAVQGRKRPILHQPVFVGKALGSVASRLPIAKRMLSADAVDFIVNPAVADNREVEAVLAPRLTPLREALESYMRDR
jgi:NADH dehydrogenase